MSVGFRFFFSETQNFFWFAVFWTGIKTTETNRTYGMGNSKSIYLTNLLLFQLVFCLFRLFRNTETVADGKRSGVSGPIWFVKMYSCAQCIMQEKPVCCRDVPCFAHMELGPGPLHSEHLRPSLSAWVMGPQSTSSLQQGWTWTMEWTLASSLPRTCDPWKMYVNIVLYFPSSNTVFWNAYQMIICTVLIVIFVRFD